jgi:hypothetical protein
MDKSIIQVIYYYTYFCIQHKKSIRLNTNRRIDKYLSTYYKRIVNTHFY